MHLILLSGGSGTRLWPLSNDSRSKQFLKVLRDADGNHVSMMQRVFAQIGNVEIDVDVTIAASESQHDSIVRQLPEGAYELVLEPERRDTAPAILLACSHLATVQGADLADTVVVMPIDTYADQAYYDTLPSIDKAVGEGVADLVLMGAVPECASEKYGYIVPANRAGDAWPVATFKEKPSIHDAEKLIEGGALWNCGVFAFKLEYAIGILDGFLGEAAFPHVRQRYAELPKTSFDYEVVEKADSVAVVPYRGSWKDLGTWNTLTEEMADATSGRVFVDDETCDDVHAINETGLPLVVAGIDSAAVVATPDGILVIGKATSSDARVKGMIADAAEERPMYERRRWGEYRVIDRSVFADGRSALVKEIVLEPGGQFSYQKHFHRSEVWTVVSGEGEAVVDGRVTPIRPGSVVNIEAGHMHAARAIEELHLIEVQLGDLLVEGDIERFGDFWP